MKNEKVLTYVLHPVQYAKILKEPATFLDQITIDSVSEVGLLVSLSSGSKMIVTPAMVQNQIVCVSDGQMQAIKPEKFTAHLKENVSEGVKWSEKVDQERKRRNRIATKKRIKDLRRIMGESLLACSG